MLSFPEKWEPEHLILCFYSGYTYYEVNLCDERNSSLEGMTVYVKRVCAYAWKHTHCHLPRVWT